VSDSNEKQQDAPKKGFWARNKKFFLIALAVYLVLMIVFILISDPSKMPFVYQFG